MILTLAEKLYGFFADSYHRKWDKRGGWRAPVPVISVGNITVGGNGKTPFVIALVKLLEQYFPHLQDRNRIAVLSRGYGRKSKELTIVEIDSHWEESGDEPLLIKRNCPKSLVISNASRIESAKVAANEFGAKLIILDDGFQHRSLARDIDLVLLDSDFPFDNGHLLPAGRLRERPPAISRASAVVSVGRGEAAKVVAEAHGKRLFHVTPAALADSWPDWPTGPSFLLTGVARPDRVKSFLAKAGVNVAGHRAFRDHHAFTENELGAVVEEARRSNAVAVLTTAKDNIRIRSWNGALPLVEIPYELSILESDELILWIRTLIDFVGLFENQRVQSKCFRGQPIP
ncbi:MAG: tetraacyldisaccharide 4'-kinase [bacterium]|nr:tetraacyldisaccharide 4'-kinase [bacterium]